MRSKWITFFVVLLLSLSALIFIREDGAEGIDKHSVDRVETRVRKWIRTKGVVEMYLYRLPNESNGFVTDRVYMGDAERAKEGLSNFPEKKSFAQSLREVGIDRAVLLRYSKDDVEGGGGNVGFGYLSSQDVILIEEGESGALGGVTLDQVDSFFRNDP